ncbi:PEP-CTERM sorting domain-containing protein [Planctomycetota bacterium]
MRLTTCRFIAVLSLMALLGGTALGQVPVVELVGDGPWLGFNDITVPMGTTVPLALRITNPENLSDWQVNLTIVGPASPLGLAPGLSWWEQLPNAFLFDHDGNPLTPDRGVALGPDASGTTRAIGMVDFVDVPPWSHSASGTVSLANLEFTYQGPGDVTVGLVVADIPNPAGGPDFPTRPTFGKADPVNGPDFNDLEMVVEFSNVEVTIHQASQSDWDFSAAVAPGDWAFGELVPPVPDPGRYGDGIRMEVMAKATDSLYVFSHWEETSAGRVPGNPLSPSLSFDIHWDVHLLAHFALIPEPLSVTMLGLGLGGLWLRRRRGRRV